MNCELFIHWNPDLLICELGPIGIRWYSTCWLIGLLMAYLLVKYIYKQQKVADEKFEPLFLYCFCGILVGARLGHCIFYEPEYFLSSWEHIVEMLLPMRQTMDGWRFTGYEGLASHGGTIGIILALLLYCRNMKMKVMNVLDMISIAVPTTACFIRLGNLMNSEIIGKPTDVPWAFIFERVDMLPRHPGQLYEAIAYACFFVIMWTIYSKHDKNLASAKTNGYTGYSGAISDNSTSKSLIGTGFYFGLDILLIFTFRFFIEYTKEVQVDFESGMLFDMGQILSIPFIILGGYFTWKGLKEIKDKR